MMARMGAVESHSESITWPAWLHLLIAGAVALCLFVAIRLLFRGQPAAAAIPFAVGSCLAIVWWRMRRLVLEFGPEGAAFGFSGLNRRVPRSAIRSAEIESYSAARYMGWGYRFGWKPRDRAYSLIGFRRGVRLQFADERGEWSVFLSCADPEAAVRALEG